MSMPRHENDRLFDFMRTRSAVVGLQGLACLAACSSLVRQHCRAVAQQDAATLLKQTLGAAGDLQPEHLPAVAWLLKHTNAATAAEAAAAAAAMVAILAKQSAETLLQLPGLPLAWAKRLVAAGVRFTWAQLQQAADSMVLGVEVWVQAVAESGIPTDIPEAASALVRGEDWGQLALAGDRLRLLQLGLNCTLHSSGSAAADATHHAAHHMPAVLDPVEARRLITTAALRQHPAVRALACCFSIHQHMDVSTLAVVLKHSAAARDIATQLFTMLSAVQLDRDVVLQLLLAAVQQRSLRVANELCKLPAAQLLTTAEVTSVLFTPAPSAYSCGCGSLCGAARWCALGLPAAQQLCGDEVGRLLVTVLKQSCRAATCCAPLDVGKLHSLSALLSSATMAAVLRAAAEALRDDCFAQLCALQAAQQLSPQEIPCLQLLQAAVQQQDSSSTSAACSSPAAQTINSSDVAGLLSAAIAADGTCQASSDKVQALCRLPGAQRIQCVAALLRAAVKVDSHNVRLSADSSCTAHLCALPAAQLLSGADCLQLLRVVVQLSSSELTCTVCRLPAAQFIGSSDIAALVPALLQTSAAAVKEWCPLIKLRALCAADLHRRCGCAAAGSHAML